MLTLPAATPFTVMVIPLTDTVALFIRRHRTEALVGCAFRLECHGQRGALPFHYRSTGWRYCHTGCRCYRAAIFCHRRASHIGDLHRAGDHFLRRHRLTDTADPATEHIDRAVREADFISPDIPFIKPRQQRLLPLLCGFPRQREAGISGGFLPLSGRGPVRIFIIKITVVIGLSSQFAGRQVFNFSQTRPVNV